MTGLNEVGAALGRERGVTLTRMFSQEGRALVECIGPVTSELWDVGAYEMGIGPPKLTENEDGPILLGTYEGRLPRGRDYEGWKRVHLMLKGATLDGC